MGRRKIAITRIEDEKNRHTTFYKRKLGLIKKASELAMLCDLKLFLIFDDPHGNIIKYSSHNYTKLVDYFNQTQKTHKVLSFQAEDYPNFTSIDRKSNSKRRVKKFKKLRVKTEAGNEEDEYFTMPDSEEVIGGVPRHLLTKRVPNSTSNIGDLNLPKPSRKMLPSPSFIPNLSLPTQAPKPFDNSNQLAMALKTLTSHIQQQQQISNAADLLRQHHAQSLTQNRVVLPSFQDPHSSNAKTRELEQLMRILRLKQQSQSPEMNMLNNFSQQNDLKNLLLAANSNASGHPEPQANPSVGNQGLFSRDPNPMLVNWLQMRGSIVNTSGQANNIGLGVSSTNNGTDSRETRMTDELH